MNLLCLMFRHKDKQIHGYARYTEGNTSKQKVINQCERCGRQETVTWCTVTVGVR